MTVQEKLEGTISDLRRRVDDLEADNTGLRRALDERVGSIHLGNTAGESESTAVLTAAQAKNSRLTTELATVQERLAALQKVEQTNDELQEKITGLTRDVELIEQNVAESAAVVTPRAKLPSDNGQVPKFDIKASGDAKTDTPPAGSGQSAAIEAEAGRAEASSDLREQREQQILLQWCRENYQQTDPYRQAKQISAVNYGSRSWLSRLKRRDPTVTTDPAIDFDPKEASRGVVMVPQYNESFLKHPRLPNWLAKREGTIRFLPVKDEAGNKIPGNYIVSCHLSGVSKKSWGQLSEAQQSAMGDMIIASLHINSRVLNFKNMPEGMSISDFNTAIQASNARDEIKKKAQTELANRTINILPKKGRLKTLQEADSNMKRKPRHYGYYLSLADKLLDELTDKEKKDIAAKLKTAIESADDSGKITLEREDIPRLDQYFDDDEPDQVGMNSMAERVENLMQLLDSCELNSAASEALKEKARGLDIYVTDPDANDDSDTEQDPFITRSGPTVMAAVAATSPRGP